MEAEISDDDLDAATEEVVNAIDRSAERICSTLVVGFDRLREAIEEQTAALSNEIQKTL